jgi:acetoin utilization deacetylase AcuC-like enzyme
MTKALATMTKALATMNIFYSDPFQIPLPPGHRFPIEKYVLLRRRVEAVSSRWGWKLEVPGAASDRELSTVHTPEYLRRVTEGTLDPMEVRRTGFPWSPALVERSRRSVGGTLASGHAALRDGVAVNLAGGTHHAFPTRGEGFCVFNDIAVAARVVLLEGTARSIAILDLDVHQGNGTAAIFREDPQVFTLSVHGVNNFPFRKEEGDLDIELPDGAGDLCFLEAVEYGVAEALAAAMPDLAFYLAGADPFVGDRLGRLSVSKDGLRRRDEIVFKACRSIGVPVAVVMGGGYATPIQDTVDIHFSTVQAAGAFALARQTDGEEVPSPMDL